MKGNKKINKIESVVIEAFLVPSPLRTALNTPGGQL